MNKEYRVMISPPDFNGKSAKTLYLVFKSNDIDQRAPLGVFRTAADTSAFLRLLNGEKLTADEAARVDLSMQSFEKRMKTLQDRGDKKNAVQ